MEIEPAILHILTEVLAVTLMVKVVITMIILSPMVSERNA